MNTDPVLDVASYLNRCTVTNNQFVAFRCNCISCAHSKKGWNDVAVVLCTCCHGIELLLVSSGVNL